MCIGHLKQALRSRLGDRGGIMHSVVTLVGGTAFAQGLAVLALPVLTRLYSPAEFKVLAVYASILGILSVIACLRLEIALPLPERDEDAASLLALSLFVGFGFSLLVVLIVLAFYTRINSWLGVPAFAPYLWMVPLGMWMSSAYAAMQFWSTRKKRFSGIARTRMAQALGGVGIQLGSGAAGFGPFGLLFGNLVSSGAGFLGLARGTWRQDRAALRTVNYASIRRVLRQYSRFPTYSTAEALANSAGMQLPVILIAGLAAGPEAAFILLATRIMAAPMALIGASSAQVYLAHAPDEMRRGQLNVFTAGILSGLLKTGVGPLIFFGIVSHPISGIVFGREWARAGELVGWMTPWFIFQFLSSPVSTVVYVAQRQRLMLALQACGFILRIGAVWIAYKFAQGLLAEYYAISGGVFYLACCFVYYHAAGLRLKDFLSSVKATWWVVAGWASMGAILRLFIEIFA